MKANVETLEPMVRAGAVTRLPQPVRVTARVTGFVPVTAAAPLFHAWRA